MTGHEFEFKNREQIQQQVAKMCTDFVLNISVLPVLTQNNLETKKCFDGKRVLGKCPGKSKLE